MDGKFVVAVAMGEAVVGRYIYDHNREEHGSYDGAEDDCGKGDVERDDPEEHIREEWRGMVMTIVIPEVLTADDATIVLMRPYADESTNLLWIFPKTTTRVLSANKDTVRWGDPDAIFGPLFAKTPTTVTADHIVDCLEGYTRHDGVDDSLVFCNRSDFHADTEMHSNIHTGILRLHMDGKMYIKNAEWKGAISPPTSDQDARVHVLTPPKVRVIYLPGQLLERPASMEYECRNFYMGPKKSDNGPDDGERHRKDTRPDSDPNSDPGSDPDPGAADCEFKAPRKPGQTNADEHMEDLEPQQNVEEMEAYQTEPCAQTDLWKQVGIHRQKRIRTRVGVEPAVGACSSEQEENHEQEQIHSWEQIRGLAHGCDLSESVIAAAVSEHHKLAQKSWQVKADRRAKARILMENHYAQDQYVLMELCKAAHELTDETKGARMRRLRYGKLARSNGMDNPQVPYCPIRQDPEYERAVKKAKRRQVFPGRVVDADSWVRRQNFWAAIITQGRACEGLLDQERANAKAEMKTQLMNMEEDILRSFEEEFLAFEDSEAPVEAYPIEEEPVTHHELARLRRRRRMEKKLRMSSGKPERPIVEQLYKTVQCAGIEVLERSGTRRELARPRKRRKTADVGQQLKVVQQAEVVQEAGAVRQAVNVQQTEVVQQTEQEGSASKEPTTSDEQKFISEGETAMGEDQKSTSWNECSTIGTPTSSRSSLSDQDEEQAEISKRRPSTPEQQMRIREPREVMRRRDVESVEDEANRRIRQESSAKRGSADKVMAGSRPAQDQLKTRMRTSTRR